MSTYLLLFVLSTCASLMLTPVVSRLSERFGWLDTPRDGRRVHQNPVPRLGGVVIFVAVLLALATLPLVNNPLTQTLRTNGPQLSRVLLPGAFIFLIGLYDDFRGTNARVKFAAQGLAGLLFCALGGRIEALSVPLIGSIELHPVIGYTLTLLWTVGICNAFNLIDGMDGLASGVALFAALVMMVVSLMLGHPLVTLVAVVLCGSLVGFLPYNFNPASIFLGDSGSLFMGFTLAALSVQGTQKASTAVAVAIPLIAFGVPVADTGFSIVRRLIGGKPLFKGDREHIHHMLLARGWSQRRVTLALYAVCALFGLAALFVVHDSGMQRTGLVLFVVSAVIVLGVGRLRYHEVDEVRATMRRSFSERRLRIANNVCMRRASRVMSKATTLSEIFSATQELLEVGDFVYATMQLGRKSYGNGYLQRADNGNGNGHHHNGNGNGHHHNGNGNGHHHNGNGNGHGRRRVNGNGNGNGNGSGHELLLEKKVLSPGREGHGPIQWAWQRGNIGANEIIGSSRFWTLRLPLATKTGEWGYLNLYREFGSEALLLDINYLWDLFQCETAKAVERVLAESVQDQHASVLAAIDAVQQIEVNGPCVEAHRPPVSWAVAPPADGAHLDLRMQRQAS
jgi:UDP-GlcNAc:undecaprenyl-phosphate/decaprenyl-phosphate GlcNAc-1-phosphate transferase